MEYPSEFGSILVTGGHASLPPGKRQAGEGAAPPPPKKKSRKGEVRDDGGAGGKAVRQLGRHQGGVIGSSGDVCRVISGSIAKCIACKEGRIEPQQSTVPMALWNDDDDEESEEERVELCSILRGVNYMENFYRIFGGTGGGGRRDHHPQSGGADIMAIGRAAEEEMMREPVHAGERRCVNGAQCHCTTIDPDMSFVGVEFVCPWEDPEGPQQMCVLCHRALVQEMLYSVIGPDNPIQPVVQRYGNLCGVPGEYKESACNTSIAFGNPAVMPLPLAVHQKSAYRVERVNGYKHIRQDPSFYFF